MARLVLQTPSRDFHEYDLLQGYIPRINDRSRIDLSATFKKYTGEKRYNSGDQDPLYKINRAIMPAAMQCLSGTCDNISSNLALYEFTGVPGIVNCTQPLPDQVTIVENIKKTVNPRLIPVTINTHDYKQRIPALVNAGANVLFVDTSHGWSEFQKETIAEVKRYDNVIVVGGNIVDAEGFNDLVKYGVDSVKVGMGVGFGCTTADVLGVGRKQATAVMDVANARDLHYKETNEYMPVISDGSIKGFSDIPKAWACGADVIMVGRLIAGCLDTPNKSYEIRARWRDGSIIYKGLGKEFYYEASEMARRRAQGLVRDYSFKYEEGKEGWVKATDNIVDFLNMGFEKVTDAVRKAGCMNIMELHEKARLELSLRPVDKNHPDLAMWDHKSVEVYLKRRDMHRQPGFRGFLERLIFLRGKWIDGDKLAPYLN